MTISNQQLDIDMRDIEYVTAVAKLQGITNAANYLNITQPALSIYIKKLEAKIGVPIFNRIGKKFILTDAGRCMIDNGEQLLRIRNNIEQELNDIKTFRGGKVTIGCTIIRGISLYPILYSSFKQIYPRVELICIEDTAQNLEKRLFEGEIDVIFINQAEISEDIKYTTLIADPMVLFVSEDIAKLFSPINKHGYKYPWIDLAQLRNHDFTFIRNSTEQHNERVTQRILKEYHIQPKSNIKIKNQLTAINMAAAGCGIYIATEYFMYNIASEKKPTIFSFGKSNQQYIMNFVAAVSRYSYQSTLISSLIEIAQNAYHYE